MMLSINNLKNCTEFEAKSVKYIGFKLLVKLIQASNLISTELINKFLAKYLERTRLHN